MEGLELLPDKVKNCRIFAIKMKNLALFRM